MNKLLKIAVDKSKQKYTKINFSSSDNLLLGTPFKFLESTLEFLLCFLFRNLIVVVVGKSSVCDLVYFSHVLLVFFVDVVEKRYLVQIFFHLTDDVGNKRWLHLLALKTTPLEVLEKRVFLYLPSPRKTQPLFLGLDQ